MNDPTVALQASTRTQLLRWQAARAIGRACLPVVLGVTIMAGMPARAAGEERWVSLGVYGSQPAAEQARARFGGAAGSMQVVPFERNGRTLYRVAAGPFADTAALRVGLRDARSRVPGAFALPVAGVSAGGTVAEEAGTSAKGASQSTVAAMEVDRDELPSSGNTRDGHVTLAAAEMPPVRAAAPVSTPGRSGAPAAAAASTDDGLAGLRLDPATERLLRDDAALQRELERLSRGLPKGLGNEIQAAQEQGVSLREVHARTMVGPQSPSTPPPGYQLHRLHRDDAPAAAGQDDE